MRVDGDWRRAAPTQAVCAVLTSAGFRALFVGGCVRNALMGVPVADVDIATDAAPEQVVALAEAAGLRVVPTGLSHGTVTVVAEHIPHEVTTFRRDLETFGRHAVVAWSNDVAVDAARRDFTMNALYAEPDGTLVDPLGGLPDLLARRVRFVGDAQARIAEDYLRILRFFRFHAWYGRDGIDAEGLAACAAAAEGIATLSRERIGAEMRRLLAAPDPSAAVAAMQAAGVLAQVLPGATAEALPVLVHLEAGRAPDWRARLSVLGGQDVAARLVLSRAEARAVPALRDTGGSAAAVGWTLGQELGLQALLVRGALLAAPLPDGAEAEVARGAAAVFPVRAADLPDLSGPALGARLRELEAAWLASDLRATREALLGA